MKNTPLFTIVMLLLVAGCRDDESSRNEQSRTKRALDAPEAIVVRVMKHMTPSELAIVDFGGKVSTPLKTAQKALSEIPQRGASAGDWIEASLEARNVNVVFEAVTPEGSARLNVERDLGDYMGPVQGQYQRSSRPLDAPVEVSWYSFGRVDIGVPVNPAAHGWVIRVRRAE